MLYPGLDGCLPNHIFDIKGNIVIDYSVHIYVYSYCIKINRSLIAFRYSTGTIKFPKMVSVLFLRPYTP